MRLRSSALRVDTSISDYSREKRNRDTSQFAFIAILHHARSLNTLECDAARASFFLCANIRVYKTFLENIEL